MLRLLSASGAAVATALAAAPCSLIAQDAAQPPAVPPAEIEQLNAELESLRLRLETLEAQAEAPPPPTEVEEERVGLLWDPTRFRPGWQRVRGPGWNEHGKLNEFNIRIAHLPEMDLYMGLHATGRFQWLTQDDVFISGAEEEDLDPGFQTAWGSIEFLADFNQQIEVYWDLYLSSKPHPDQPQGHEGYMLFRELPGPLGDIPLIRNTFDLVDVQAGLFEIDFGDARYRRTDNARSQRNPLIGNYVVDPVTTEIGMEVFSDRRPLKWLVGVGSGTETGDFNNRRGFSFHGKIWGEVTDGLRLAASAYRVDHSRNPPNATRANLFRTSRSGGPLGGVFGAGNAPGQLFIGAGQELTALQADATFTMDALELYANFGWVEDADLNGSLPGSPEDRWFYYAAEASYGLAPRAYVAARYSGALAQQVGGASSDGLVHRIEVGGGYWIHQTILAKLSYVFQTVDDFDEPTTLFRNVEAWRDPWFHGIMTEVSFSF